MKNVFASIALASFVALPSLLAAEAIGLVSALPCSAETLLGGYVAVGLLALAHHDYGRGSARRQPRVTQPSRPRSAVQPVRHHPVLGWAHHTVSA